MIKYRSLTTKFIFISLIIVAVLAVNFYVSSRFTQDIKGDATRINIAGRQRLLAVRMMYSAKGILDPLASPAEREEYRSVFNAAVNEYEEVLYSLRGGNQKIGLKPLAEQYKDSILQLNALINLWQKTQKPVLLSIRELHPERRNEACVKCHAAVRGNFKNVDAFLKSLERNYEKEIEDFNSLKFSILGLLIIVAGFIVFYVRYGIIKPIRKLKGAANKIEKGNFDIRVETKSKDEIGTLSNSFNNMAQTLDMLFAEKSKHMQELNVLNKISDASKSIELQDMLDEVLDEILNLEPLKLERKGAIFLCDEDKKTLKLVVSRHFNEEHESLCSTVPYGECLCGLCAEKAEILVSENSAADKRHTKTFPDMKEHGQIFLPLKSRDKILGVLNLYLPEGVKLSGKDVALYKSISDIISVSIQNAINHNEIKKFAFILEATSDFVAIGLPDGRVNYYNKAARRILGIGENEDISNIRLPDTHPERALRLVMDEGIPTAIRDGIWSGETAFLNRNGSEIPVLQVIIAHKSPDGTVEFLSTIARDITERKNTENIIMVRLRLVQFAYTHSLDEVLQAALDEVEAITGSLIGFCHFLEADQKTLSLQNWSTRTLKEFCSVKVNARHYSVIQAGVWVDCIHQRRPIIHNDYASLPHRKGMPDGHAKVIRELVVPVFRGDQIVAILGVGNKLTDYNEKDIESVSLLADLAWDIAERKRAEETIKRNYQIQNVLNSLLNVSLEGIPLKELLVKALDIILSVPFLPLMPKGGIFVVEDESEVLILTANQGFSVPIQELCARVPFGRCLCGRAAASRQIQFADCLDERHENLYDGMTPHGHYNVPILSMGKVLGVLVLYLQEGHQQGKSEIEFLQAVADTLAGIVERKRAEEDLKQNSKELLSLADASNVILTTTTITKLYETICETVVRNFSLKMAWLGLVVKDSYDVKLAGQCGFDDGYLKNMKITWDDSPTGMGPVGMAIKTKTAHVVNDIQTDARFELWREKAVKRGLRSTLAAPMIASEGEVIGTINLYSEEAHFFTPQRKKLFQVFANQAATAIENALLVEGLEQKVSKRTQEFETANRQLLTVNEELALRRSEAETAKMQADTANRAKSDFLANMSHELRTPLNAIIGFSDIMINGQTGPMTDEQMDFTRDIGKSGKHLLILINDILDLSKVEAGKMELEPVTVHVQELIERSLVMFKEKAMRHHINVDQRVEDGITDIIADEMKLKQVLVNLLSNAFKFTQDGGSVRVRARRVRSMEFGVGSGIDSSASGVRSSERARIYYELRTQHSELDGNLDFVEISVSDTGPGIRPADIPKLFQPFQQLDVTLTKKVPGTGLGLNLCKKFVELHGGKIWVETEVGKGSTFVFVIPVRQGARI